MRRQSAPLSFLFAALLCAAPLLAQRTHSPVAAPPEPAGTVTGHVYLNDTNGPARFAHVSLEAMPDLAAEAAPKSTDANSVGNNTLSKPVPVLQPAHSPGNTSIVTDTALDGSFTLANVKPGSYFVIVNKDGYMNPRTIFTDKEIHDPSANMQQLIHSALTVVKVDSAQTATAEVRIERGAAVSGTVLYDDGSAAGEIKISLLHKDATGKWIIVPNSDFGVSTQTDDRGNFRMQSLLPDTYMLQAGLSLGDTKTNIVNEGKNQMEFRSFSSRFELQFYGAGTPRQSQAGSIKLRSGEELGGQNITLPIGTLRRLTGRVAAGRDAHFINAATVQLLTRDDSKQLAETKISRDDGLFHFEFIPPGDYILHVVNAARCGLGAARAAASHGRRDAESVSARRHGKAHQGLRRYRPAAAL